MFGIKTRLLNEVTDSLVKKGYGHISYDQNGNYIVKEEEVIDNLILENEHLMNTHVGERCFILGNGPSLKNVSLELLADEYVFTVNSFNRVTDAYKAKPNFHFLMDANYFELREDISMDDNERQSIFKEMGNICDVFFVPITAEKYIKKKGLDKLGRFHYLYIDRPYMDENCEEMDLMGKFPSYTTVVQHAIAVAICMGFKEIYVTGIDSTLVITFLNNKIGNYMEAFHAFEAKEISRGAVDYTKTNTTSDILYDQYMVFKGYDNLATYCAKKDIKLYNCSEASLVDSLEKKKISDAFID